uniref:serine/threonine-protein kinase n=1 Tax=Saccharothrix mutabilis TaxID=33921 RepID=UPI0031E275B5
MSENVLAGRYRLDERIGGGRTAEVHRGWDTLLKRHVAVKVFPAAPDAETARRFDDEVRTLAALSHPGLVAVYDADTDAGRPFVVMRLVEGHTLREEIDRGPMPPDRVRRVGADVAQALAHAYEHGVVNREIKPSNVLLDDKGDAHLAPEQGTGPEVDVHALGLVLLECLTGGRDRTALPEHVPADLRDLLTRMTAPPPADRPTPRECALALSAAAAPARPVPVDSPTADTVVIPKQRTVWKALAGSTVALLTAMAVTTALNSTPASTGNDPAAPPAAPEPAAQPTSGAPRPEAGQPQPPAVAVLAPQKTTSDAPGPTTAQPTTPPPTTARPTSVPTTGERPVTTTPDAPTTEPEPTTTPAPTTESSVDATEDPSTRP